MASIVACHPALFNLPEPVPIVRPPEPPARVADGGGALDAGAVQDVEQYTPPARIYGATQVCARLASLACSEGLTPACGYETAPRVDAECVLSATTVDEVRRCRGVVCP